MPHRLTLISMPASREPVSLLAVDRAVSELRRGLMVVIRGLGGNGALALAAEAVTPQALSTFAEIAVDPAELAITARRARALGLTTGPGKAVALSVISNGDDGGDGKEANLTAERIHGLADPLSRSGTEGLASHEATEYGWCSAAVSLAKIARLLPAAVTAGVGLNENDDLAAWAARHDLLLVDSGDVFQYEHTAARTLSAVSEARVPLSDAENTRIIAFRPSDGGLEHLAIIIGEPKPDGPVLARLHSECFTGDLLGSLRCDCGDQLRGAITEIAAAGSGVLLYLAQEGRGIGLVNKLRAYALQDNGFDTLDANEQLGFDADERIYLPAARMLRQLGFTAVRLMTNNPDKVAALAALGITVTERVAHRFPSNRHNEAYLETKKVRSGHLF